MTDVPAEGEARRGASRSSATTNRSTGKADEYRKQLLEFVRKTRGAKPNGNGFPRIVLFSPIAHEDTHNPNLPDGMAHNVRLAAYTKATRSRGEGSGRGLRRSVPSVAGAVQERRNPLTINGVHLSEEGNRQLAEVIAGQLLGKPVSTSPRWNRCAQAVLDKDLHWWNRYRASDGNDIWGGRSTLTFVNGQTNADVLQPELAMLDVMTANRDERIWAAPPAGQKGGRQQRAQARAGDLQRRRRQQEFQRGEGRHAEIPQRRGRPSSRWRSPRDSRSTCSPTRSRFPQLIKPVQMQFDTKGRLWAAVWPTLPEMGAAQADERRADHPPRRRQRRRRGSRHRVCQSAESARLRVLERRRDRHLPVGAAVPEGHRRR